LNGDRGLPQPPATPFTKAPLKRTAFCSIIDTYTFEDFDRMVAINVRAAFVGIQAAAQEMNDGGRIVIIGSITAIRTAFPGASVYSMTKAALIGLVRGAAIARIEQI
jgi:NAD(P)-dependent dehydrogenase (short-subunit alcohol dehydrogenase family)